MPVTGGVHLHAHRWDGTGRPYVLVHGLASNARLWHGVASRLAEVGHLVVAVDQRGHGRSEKPGDGYTIETCAADLTLLVEGLGLDRPVVAGQSWGGNVVLQLAADQPRSVHGVALVDGGWIRLQDTFGDWDDCARQLRPPALAGLALSRLEAAVRLAHPSWPDEGVDATLANFEVLDDGTIRPWLTLDRHLAIQRDLWEHDPRALYARVTAPVLLVPADHGEPAGDAVPQAGVRGQPVHQHEWAAGAVPPMGVEVDAAGHGYQLALHLATDQPRPTALRAAG